MTKLWIGIGTKKVPQTKRLHNNSTQSKKVPNAPKPKGFTYGNADTKSFASEARAKFFALFSHFQSKKEGK